MPILTLLYVAHNLQLFLDFHRSIGMRPVIADDKQCMHCSEQLCPLMPILTFILYPDNLQLFLGFPQNFLRFMGDLLLQTIAVEQLCRPKPILTTILNIDSAADNLQLAHCAIVIQGAQCERKRLNS